MTIDCLKRKSIVEYFKLGPDWANWLAKDRDGDCYWFSNQPEFNSKGNWKDRIPDGKVKFFGKVSFNTGKGLWNREGLPFEGQRYGR